MHNMPHVSMKSLRSDAAYVAIYYSILSEIVHGTSSHLICLLSYHPLSFVFRPLSSLLHPHRPRTQRRNFRQALGMMPCARYHGQTWQTSHQTGRQGNTLSSQILCQTIPLQSLIYLKHATPADWCRNTADEQSPNIAIPLIAIPNRQ